MTCDDEGLHPKIKAAFRDFLEADEPPKIVPQHWGKRGNGRAESACGVTGQTVGFKGAVTCPECRKHLAKLEARRAKR